MTIERIPPEELQADKWMEQVREWADSHPQVQGGVCDDRQGIYDAEGGDSMDPSPYRCPSTAPVM